MLQRLLTGVLEQEGVEQAVMFDDRGRLMASVSRQGQLPALEDAVALTSAALSACVEHELGDLYEIWSEGEQRTMIDVITPYRILMLKGQGGRLARWRHSVDHRRRQLATTPEF